MSFCVWSNWNFVSGYIKNVETHPASFSSKNQVIKKLSPKSLWQTYMKWTVVHVYPFPWIVTARKLVPIKQTKRSYPHRGSRNEVTMTWFLIYVTQFMDGYLIYYRTGTLECRWTKLKTKAAIHALSDFKNTTVGFY